VFVEDSFWVHLVLAVRVTDHQRRFRFPYRSFTQLYISLKYDKAFSLLSDYFESVHWWFTLNGLSLNPDKSETIIIGTGARQRSEGSLEVIDLGNVHIQPSESVRSPGVVIAVVRSTR